MKDSELLSILRRREQDSLGGEYGDLQKEREEALDFYFGRAKGPLAGPDGEDRSQIVDKTLMETIEWILPTLIKIFLSDDVVQFDPMGPEDEQQAKQESAIVNHEFKRNGGFMVLYNWFKDTLLQKNGYVISSYDDSKMVMVEEYSGLDDMDLFSLAQDWEQNGLEYEFIEYEEENGLYSLKVRLTDNDGKFVVDGITPENMRVTSKYFANIQKADYIGDRVIMTRSDLILAGFDKKLVDSLPKYTEETNEESLTRNTLTEEDEHDTYDPATDDIELFREFIRVDFDEDGIAELRKVLRTDSKLLENEETDLVEYSSLTAIPMPHRHMGLSIHDLLKDLVQIKTMLWRQMVDNVVNVNNPGIIVDTNKLNVSDVLVDRPRRIIRAQGDVNNSYGLLETPEILGRVIPAMQFIETAAERRSGGSGASLAADADVLKSSTKGAFQDGLNAANLRIEAIARIFAETGVKALFLNLHAQMVKHQTFRKRQKILNQWVDVDPREWRKRESLSINVGLGNTSNEQRLENLMSIAAVQEKAAQAGIVQPDNVYNLAEDITRAVGFEAQGRYFTSPENLPPPQPQPNPLVEVEQVKQQGRKESDQVKAQIQVLQLQAQQDKERRDEALKAQKEAEELRIKRDQLELDAANTASQIQSRSVEDALKKADADLKAVESSEAYQRALEIVEEQSQDEE